MIPFAYSLRKEIRVEKHGDSYIVRSDMPLNLVRVRQRAVKILRLCDGRRTPQQIADACGATEEQVFGICEYFNKKGVLHIGPAECNDGYSPTVTVIIPTKDRRDELAECLESITRQDYPKEKIELIVVDDGSRDGTADLVRTFPCRLLVNTEGRGQSYCRNLAAGEANGEILAFIDSDCVAGSAWLREIVPYFRWDKVGAVGGYVDGYFHTSALDRYEKAFSPLHMGKHVLYDNGSPSTFYTPTCNLLVRRRVYMETGGIDERMSVGEDVDFCWRMRRRGYYLLYSPSGMVKHKHRNDLGRMMKRRADYGTSEAPLYTLHREKRKMFQLPSLAAIAFLSLCIAILSFSLFPLLAAAGCFLFEAATKTLRIMRSGVHVTRRKIVFSTVRTYFSLFYFVSFHVVRYYVIFLLPLGILFPPLWPLCLFMLILSALVDYTAKRPRLVFPVFFFYYFLDHLSYQVGVLLGCVRAGTFRSYRPGLVRKAVVCGK
ncbi:MAG: mycofactocin biosynthesis glycosyltransferase MftF [Syntrophorhabdales bacterium]|jgi:mycofactocin system glycosyltransferase